VRGEAGLNALDPGGLEVLDTDLDRFASVLTMENHTLTRALTDPRSFSGIGNAYSDEILFEARLSPLALTQKLTREEIERLFKAVRSTLTRWVDELRAETGDGFPEKVTAFRENMAVHGRYKEPCVRCGTKIQRIRYAANETITVPVPDERKASGRSRTFKAVARRLAANSRRARTADKKALTVSGGRVPRHHVRGLRHAPEERRDPEARATLLRCGMLLRRGTLLRCGMELLLRRGMLLWCRMLLWCGMELRSSMELRRVSSSFGARFWTRFRIRSSLRPFKTLLPPGLGDALGSAALARAPLAAVPVADAQRRDAHPGDVHPRNLRLADVGSCRPPGDSHLVRG